VRRTSRRCIHGWFLCVLYLFSLFACPMVCRRLIRDDLKRVTFFLLIFAICCPAPLVLGQDDEYDDVLDLSDEEFDVDGALDLGMLVDEEEQEEQPPQMPPKAAAQAEDAYGSTGNADDFSSGATPEHHSNTKPAFSSEDVTVAITSPRMGQVLPDEQTFQVTVEIGLESEEYQGVFKEVYKDSFLCLSLDMGPSACYPLFFEIPIRMKADKGVHTIHAHITHPETGDLDEDTRSDTITFRLGPQDVPRLGKPPPGMEIDIPKGEEDGEKEQEKVQLGLPMISVDFPGERDSIPDDRFDVVASVSAPEPEMFNKHFVNGLIGVSLDGGHYACFPVVDAKYYPRFMNVDGGVHFLEAQLVHPNSKELIADTSSGPRTFQSRPRASARRSYNVDIVVDQNKHTFVASHHKARGTEALNFCKSHNVFSQDCVLNLLRGLIQQIKVAF
jgi:hypothetical protein